MFWYILGSDWMYNARGYISMFGCTLLSDWVYYSRGYLCLGVHSVFGCTLLSDWVYYARGYLCLGVHWGMIGCIVQEDICVRDCSEVIRGVYVIFL